MHKKTPYSAIKENARMRLNENFGTAFFIIFVIDFFYFIIRFTLTLPITLSHPIIDVIYDDTIMIIITTLNTLVTLKLLIPYVRGKDSFSLKQLFDYDKRLLSILVYTIVFFIPTYITSYPIIVYLLSLVGYDGASDVSYQAMSMFHASSDTHLYYLIPVIILSIIFLYLSVRFMFASYLIVDQSLPVIDAFKMSWQITKHSVLRIIFFPFSYLLWFLAIPFPFGLIGFYVIPYYIIGLVELYETLLMESGQKRRPEKEVVFEYDPLEI
ncbi:MAG: DUF975 family protein [Candidatus Izemoplasma sp.]|nr:DUF975 family protein [Candidatus Izemoplasma sp.]